jgi:hypothetical protein
LQASKRAHLQNEPLSWTLMGVARSRVAVAYALPSELSHKSSLLSLLL